MTQSKPKKVSLDEVIHLVEQLSSDQQEQLRQRLNRDAAESLAAAPHSFMDWKIDIEQLATEQGVPASCSIESLKGDFWPDNEDIDEFIATVRQWRKESRV